MIILDGGLGRELQAMGAPFRQPEWSALALMEGPEFVRAAHDAFLQAGADIVTTNSYAVVPFHIGEDVFAARAPELLRLSGELARAAADAAARDVQVAASVPPMFGSYQPDKFDPDMAVGMAASAPEISTVFLVKAGIVISNTAPPAAAFRAVSLPSNSDRIPDEIAKPKPTPSPAGFVV